MWAENASDASPCTLAKENSWYKNITWWGGEKVSIFILSRWGFLLLIVLKIIKLSLWNALLFTKDNVGKAIIKDEKKKKIGKVSPFLPQKVQYENKKNNPWLGNSLKNFSRFRYIFWAGDRAYLFSLIKIINAHQEKNFFYVIRKTISM